MFIFFLFIKGMIFMRFCIENLRYEFERFCFAIRILYIKFKIQPPRLLKTEKSGLFGLLRLSCPKNNRTKTT